MARKNQLGLSEWDKFGPRPQRLSERKKKQEKEEVIPPALQEWLENAEKNVQPKETISIRLDADVLAWFKTRGKGYQTLINAVLKSYVLAQEKKDSAQK